MPSYKAALVVAALAAVGSAHTTFTTLFVNGVNQGDGTCVRQSKDPQTATYPLTNLASPDMICGRDGLLPVNFTCAAPAEATLTFEFREYPDGSQAGAIDPSHKGPCAVYMKPVAGSMADVTTTATTTTSGWFKIWEDGFDPSTGQWCTEKLMASNGLLSIALPSGLPGGGYLVRPELLSLHEAQVGNPQFYVGCAQVFLAGGSSSINNNNNNNMAAIPANKKVSIPGYVETGDPSVSFNIYESPPTSYLPPGPPVYTFPDTAAGESSTASQISKAPTAASNRIALTAADIADAAAAAMQFVPTDCLVKNANWCGVEVATYSTEAGCWDASADCFAQEAACYASAPPSGHANCRVWDAKCVGIQTACAAGSFQGPPHAHERLEQVEAVVPGPIPGPLQNRNRRRKRSQSSA